MRYLGLILGLLFFMTSHALSLRDDAPSRYVVQPGDTLWDIASKYLEKPWDWQALWHANPKIKNPNRIYPGAILELHFHKNVPYIKVLSNGTVKLSPHMRPKPIEDPIPAIPLADIGPFFNGSLVLDKDSLTSAPYVVALSLEHLLGGQGDEVFVKDLCPDVPPPGAVFSYALYRPHGEYVDPKDGSFLGFKATLVGYAELLRRGDPATIVLTDIVSGVEVNDRVMPRNYPEFDMYFEPRVPSKKIDGEIIDLTGDYTQGAVGLVAVIDRGRDEGLQPGDVLAIFSQGRAVKTPKCDPYCVQIPSEPIGELMVFRAFTHTSFALVVRSTRAIQKLDTVTNP